MRSTWSEANEPAAASQAAFRAEPGIAKHLGGREATRELVELCHVRAGSRVLDVGCGTGCTACRVARGLGATVVGVDVEPESVAWASARVPGKQAARFTTSDACALPFADASFDAVIGEGLLACVPDKQRVLGELLRVTRPGGRVGLHESTWLSWPPPAEMHAYLDSVGGDAGCLDPHGWQSLLERAGLGSIVARTRTVTLLGDVVGRLRAASTRRPLRTWGLLLARSLRDPDFRRRLARGNGLLPAPRGFFAHWGYGLYVGRKSARPSPVAAA